MALIHFPPPPRPVPARGIDHCPPHGIDRRLLLGNEVRTLGTQFPPRNRRRTDPGNGQISHVRLVARPTLPDCPPPYDWSTEADS